VRPTSVRLRLLVWNTGLLALVLIGFVLIAQAVIRSYLVSDIDRRIEDMARRFAEGFAGNERPPGPPPGGPPPERRGETRGREQSPFRPDMRMFDLEGVAFKGPGQSEAPADKPWDPKSFAKAASGQTVVATVQEEDVTLRVLSRPLVRDGKRLGVLQVAASYAETQALLGSMTSLSLILVPCALVVAGLGGLILTNRALQPVRRITESANSLNPDDLSQRLPVVGADEFAGLARTMNGMLERIEDAFVRLSRSFERERRFTADASHELRTPLTAMKANTTLALRGDRTPEQYREALQAVDSAADAMIRLVQGLLLLARSDRGQLELVYESVDLRELLDDAAAAARSNQPQAPVRIRIAEDAGAIRGDPDHLSRLIVNLLENALRHTPPDGEVTIEANGQGDNVVLSVADTGEGIPAEHLQHLGERFYRVDTARSREHGGTGLGLAICNSIVAAHGGTLTIDSAPGRGTRVTISLPRAP
jgi:heavy metal sensor kinase